MSEENKRSAQGLYDLFNGADPGGVREFIAENAVDHEGIPGMDTNGPDGFVRIVSMLRGAFPDLKADISHMVSEGDLVVAHYRMSGTHQGTLSFGQPIPATGKRVDLEGFDLMRFENGKAVEHWGAFDSGQLMQQLGLMPGGQQ